MTQPNIVWTRIDERLLHGQIRITWENIQRLI
ncbi:PTS system N-acetylgalactosamine-specific transporter subunit IIB [Salmonella enterica subsp. arizonae]|uniref:PTS system N-acetylgalactosamine-specific transporter subunit IIB n=1 Tax=Salmonella enterica subsp. arizonae TaxID=59203 RepID=A0A2X4TBU8_SALER|nr:PTS system N-acetylgalactosamine-specific transporter subunit IIB [Salmonella enterica subsp. arizonae]